MIDGTARGAAAALARETFKALLPKTGSLLALDLSRRRIGLAGSDAGRRVATALATWQRRSMAKDIARLKAVCHERQVVGLVIGLPLNMDGSESAMAGTMRGWARHIAANLVLPVLLQDERLSSELVRQAIDEGRLARPKAGEALDHHAAAVILEDALAALAT